MILEDRCKIRNNWSELPSSIIPMYVLPSIHKVRALNRPNVLEAYSPMSSYDNFRDGAAQFWNKWKNSVLLLTVVFTLSVHRGHYIEVIIRCTWNSAYFKHDKVWDLLRELIPKGFLSRSPQRKCRNVCKHDCPTVKNECFSNYFSLIMSVWISDADS